MTWPLMTRSWLSTLRPYFIHGLLALECGLSIMSSSSDLISREDLPSWALSQDLSFDLLIYRLHRNGLDQYSCNTGTFPKCQNSGFSFFPVFSNNGKAILVSFESVLAAEFQGFIRY